MVAKESILLDQLIDEQLLALDEVFLEPEDYKDKNVLIAGVLPARWFPGLEKCKSVVLLQPEKQKGLFAPPEVNIDNVVNVDSAIEKLNYGDESFDIVILRDLSTLVEDIEESVREIGRILKDKGDLIFISKVSTSDKWNNIHVVENFEKEFTVEVEKQTEWFPNGGKQSLKQNPMFMYEVAQPDRPAIVFARLRKNSDLFVKPVSVGPYTIDDRCYSIDRGDQQIPIIDHVQLSETMMENISGIQNNPENSLSELRTIIDDIYLSLST
jgi:SAM-dependent methyltransferase